MGLTVVIKEDWLEKLWRPEFFSSLPVHPPCKSGFKGQLERKIKLLCESSSTSLLVHSNGYAQDVFP